MAKVIAVDGPSGAGKFPDRGTGFVAQLLIKTEQFRLPGHQDCPGIAPIGQNFVEVLHQCPAQPPATL